MPPIPSQCSLHPPCLGACRGLEQMQELSLQHKQYLSWGCAGLSMMQMSLNLKIQTPNTSKTKLCMENLRNPFTPCPSPAPLTQRNTNPVPCLHCSLPAPTWPYTMVHFANPVTKALRKGKTGGCLFSQREL